MPKPARIPKSRMKCQYSVHWPRQNMDTMRQMLPAKIKCLGPYLSKIGPM